MPPIFRHAIRPIITVVAGGACAALVACGGSSEADSQDEQASFEDAQLEFAQCMRENGVDIPDPEPGQGGGIIFDSESGIDPSSDSFQAAQEECGSILDEAIPEGERPDPAEMRDQLHQMTECLRDKGYDVPEPQIVGPGDDPPSEPPTASGDFEELQDDPEFQQAQEDCADEAGLEGGPGGGPPGGPGNESG